MRDDKDIHKKRQDLANLKRIKELTMAMIVGFIMCGIIVGFSSTIDRMNDRKVCMLKYGVPDCKRAITYIPLQ